MENEKLTQNSEENKQEVVTKMDNSKNFVIPQAENNNKKRFANKKRNFNNKRGKQKQEFEQKLVEINRVTVVTKGGRRFSFSALVVIGNKKGVVGWGSGKANEIPDAIKKAIKNASKRLITVPIIDKRTIPHIQNSKFLASKVLIKPAPKGKGIIASTPVRAVVELAGYKDIYTKTLGSRSKSNVVKATINALEQLRTIEDTAKMRGVEVERLLK